MVMAIIIATHLSSTTSTPSRIRAFCMMGNAEKPRPECSRPSGRISYCFVPRWSRNSRWITADPPAPDWCSVCVCDAFACL